VVRKVIGYSLSRPTREILFTVISRHEKYKVRERRLSKGGEKRLSKGGEKRLSKGGEKRLFKGGGVSPEEPSGYA
jgi:hypothetical protein